MTAPRSRMKGTACPKKDWWLSMLDGAKPMKAGH